MAESFESVQTRAREAATQGTKDQSQILRLLDAGQRKVLPIFQDSEWITASQIAELFGLQPRTARVLCQKWVAAGFIIISEPSKKGRKYHLHKKFVGLIS